MNDDDHGSAWHRLRRWITGLFDTEARGLPAPPKPVPPKPLPPPDDVPATPATRPTGISARDRVEIHERDDFRFTTPALGDGYDFEVNVACDWCAEKISGPELSARRAAEEELRESLNRARANVRDRIADAVRRTARDYPIHRAAELERALDPALRDCLDDGDVQVVTAIRVNPPDEVRERLKHHAIEHLDLDLGKDLSIKRSDRTTEEHRAWQLFLHHALGDQVPETLEPKLLQAWLAPYAARLAADPRVASQVVEEVITGQVNNALRLLAGLGQQIENHRTLDVFDFVVQYDTALRQVLVALGVQGLPSSAGAPPWTEEERKI